ncbi:hypothetical protein J6590_029278 [Homalodisca vitripennis]|nr:hypothetical protein J6590_029278 [Homalodisca vitripennis]
MLNKVSVLKIQSLCLYCSQKLQAANWSSRLNKESQGPELLDFGIRKSSKTALFQNPLKYTVPETFSKSGKRQEFPEAEYSKSPKDQNHLVVKSQKGFLNAWGFWGPNIPIDELQGEYSERFNAVR